ncbi:MAG: insulinase family protein [Spirochaetales bacterium]|nr:insulinase family protein [Spirochaetales bacterium]
MKRLIPLVTVLALLLVSCPTTGIATPHAKSTVLPFDSAVTAGTLPNGLRFYIRANGEPAGRVEMRLAVNAGSVLEDDDQRGLAHFVEHLAFDGSLHFEKNELQSTLESMGMRFGNDLNASTSYDETIYRLQVPVDGTNGAENLDTGLLILEDWAHNLTFDPDEVEKERKVIQEEWRTGRGAAERIREAQMKVLFTGSRYAERRPIGDMNVVRTASVETIRRFYADWYRPDLMAVIVVGAVDPAAVEQKIRGIFGPLPNPAHERPRPEYTVTAAAAPAVSVNSDKEATASAFSLYVKRPARDLVTEADYRRQLVEYLFHGMLSDRLGEIARKPGAPFLGAYSTQGRIVRPLEAVILGGQTKEDGIPGGIEAALTELERVRRFGFTATELERAKQDLLSGIQQSYEERDKRRSATLAAEYIRNFLEREASPGLEYEYELYKRFVPAITIEEVNDQAMALYPDRGRVLLVSVPERPGLTPPDGQALLSLFAKVKTLSLEPYRDVTLSEALVAEPPAPGKVVKEKTIPELGVIVWTLSNGARVMLKPTDFKNDEIVMRSYAPGGESLASDADFIPAATAADLVALSGLGPFSRDELGKKLAGVQASVAPRIDDLTGGLSGSAAPKDFSTLLKLVYLYFTAAKIDPSVFQSYREKLKEAVAQRSASPGNIFSDTIQTLLSQNNPRSRPLTLADIDKLDAAASLRFFKARFADASNFNFYFVGNIDPAVLRPLVETWLGGLPSAGRKETWKDLGIRPPAGVVQKDVRMGKDPKSEEAIIFHGEFDWNMKNVTAIAALSEAATIRLTAKIREQEGGTYSLGAFDIPQRIPRQAFLFYIEFGADPTRVAKLTGDIFAELDKFKTDGPTGEETDKAKQIILKEREVNLKTNAFWAEVLKNYAMWGEDQRDILEYAKKVRALTREDLKDAARRYLPEDSYIRVTLLPAGSK